MTEYLLSARTPSRFGWVIWSILALCADQLSKYWAVHNLVPYHAKPIVEHLSLYLSFNPGAAFSLLSNAGGWQRELLIGIALVVSFVIVVSLSRISPARKAMRLGLALMLGGAIGNLIDRIYLGYVIDFIDVFVQPYHWPAFNIADCSVCLGGLLLLTSQKEA